MPEAVIVRQNKDFEIAFWLLHAHGDEEPAFHPVKQIHELSPYTMRLTSLASCTSILLHTYAQHHQLDLEEVELRLQYGRVFNEDCENCEDIDTYEEQIEEVFVFTGNLSPKEQQRLFQIAKQCPIYKMLHNGVQVKSWLQGKGEE